MQRFSLVKGPHLTSVRGEKRQDYDFLCITVAAACDENVSSDFPPWRTINGNVDFGR